MEAFFEQDPFFEAFADRAFQMVSIGGATYGECRATTQRIVAGDRDSWYREWTATAGWLREVAASSAARNHEVSAREAYLRASTYYRISYYPLFGAPVDPRLVKAFELEADCFAQFAARQWPPVQPVQLPFEGTRLSGYLCLVDDSGRPRPTILAVNGYDSNVHEMYWAHAVPSIRRGYNCLLVDGPGQGGALIVQGLHIRPDWETVVRPIMDWALERPEVDPRRLAIVGWSFGGWLAPRAAAGDPRAAALVADPGQWDQMDAIRARLPLPEEQRAKLPEIEPTTLQALVDGIAGNPLTRWQIMQRGLWVNGVQSFQEYLRDMARYTISDVVDGIRCPALITWAEGDAIASQADKLYAGLRGPKEFVRFTAAEGAGGHCEGWNRSLYEQRVFDWLDEVLQLGST